MQRISRFLVIVALLAMSFNQQAAWAANGVQPAISVIVDGRLIKTEVPPIINNGRTLVPLRAVAEALNLQVVWNAADQMITLTSSQLQLVLTIGSCTAWLNNEPLQMDTPPTITNGRTLVPLRFIGEAIGCEVNWNDINRVVTINSPPVPLKVLTYYALGNSWTDLFSTAYPEAGLGNTDIVNTIALGWYTLGLDGSLSTSSQSGWSQPQGWEDVLLAADQHNLDTQMTVHMTNTNSAIMNLLSNEAAVDAAVTSITEAADSYDGVNLDLEGLGWNDTDAELLRVQQLFSQFVNKLSLSLHQGGKTLALSLHPLNSAYRGYDYQALGALADQIIIMAYDYGPTPEPIDQVNQAVSMAQQLVPSEKLYLGISVPSETPASIGEKVALASKSRLAGIAIWRLGLIPDAMWEQLKINPNIAKKGQN